MSDELLPCPHCGGHGSMRTWLVTREFAVQCDACNGGTNVYDTEAEAVAAWNRRVGWQPVEHVRLPDGTELYADEIAITNGKRGVAYYTITLPEDGSVRLCRKACPEPVEGACPEPVEGACPEPVEGVQP